MPRARTLVASVTVALVVSVSGCSAPIAHGDAAAVAPPPAGAAFDYQLGGAYPPPDGVRIVARDRTAAPADAGYDICYVNGFQTQPDASDEWLGERSELLVHRDGEPLADPDWPDEYLFDASTAAKRSAIVARVGPWIEGCADDGYDAVEIDNLDSFTRSEGAFGVDEAVALAGAYVEIAHAAGLAIGQKNAAEHADRMHDLGFDFAVTESCLVYDECVAYTDVYDVVLDIEYTDELAAAAFTTACDSPDRPSSLILRDPLLLPAGHPDHTYTRCP
jgi:hypothetical protein